MCECECWWCVFLVLVVGSHSAAAWLRCGAKGSSSTVTIWHTQMFMCGLLRVVTCMCTPGMNAGVSKTVRDTNVPASPPRDAPTCSRHTCAQSSLLRYSLQCNNTCNTGLRGKHTCLFQRAIQHAISSSYLQKSHMHEVIASVEDTQR